MAPPQEQEQRPYDLPADRVDVVWFPEGIRTDLENTAAEMDQAASIITNANRAFSQYEETVITRGKRIRELQDEVLTPQYEVVSSIVTHSAVYRKLHAELTAQGISDDEIARFFKEIIDNQQRYTALYGEQGRTMRRILRQGSIGGMKVQGLRLLEQPASWFRGSQADWSRYIHSVMNFNLFLHDGDPRVHDITGKEFSLLEYFDICYIHAIEPTAEPKWFSEYRANPANPPDINRVNDEFEEDNQERLLVEQRYRLAERQIAQMRDLYEEKDRKSDAYLRGISAKLWARANTSLLHLLLSTSVIDRLNREPSVIESINNGIVGRFFNTHVLEPAITALWAEQAIDRQEVTPESLRAVLAAKDNPDELQRVLREIRETGKKQQRFARFKLLPLIQSLSPSEVDYVRGCMDANSGMSQGEWLYALGEVIALHRDEIYPMEAVPELNAGKVTVEITTFGLNYVIDNRAELLRRLRGRLAAGAPEPRQPVYIPDELPTETPIEDGLLEAAQDVPVTVEEATNVIQSPLHGWNVQYILKHESHAPQDRVTISGATYEELEQALQDFIGQNKIPFTIRIQSLVHALETIVQRDPALDEQTPRLNRRYSQVDYKKERMGKRQRLLYRIDRDTKELVFFLNLKKAYTYDL